MAKCPLRAKEAGMGHPSFVAFTSLRSEADEGVRPSTRLFNCECQGQEGLLFDLVGLGAAGGWTGTRTALHAENGAISGDAFQARQHVEHGSHVCRLFLYPDDVGGLPGATNLGAAFFLGGGSSGS